MVDFNWAVVEAQGRSGGMVCMWVFEFIKVEALLKGDRWIAVKGHIEELQMVGVICVVYGYHDSIDRRR